MVRGLGLQLAQELTLQGDRLHYELISGAGPRQGWVSTRLQEKALLEPLPDVEVGHGCIEHATVSGSGWS